MAVQGLDVRHVHNVLHFILLVWWEPHKMGRPQVITEWYRKMTGLVMSMALIFESIANISLVLA